MTKRLTSVLIQHADDTEVFNSLKILSNSEDKADFEGFCNRLLSNQAYCLGQWVVFSLILMLDTQLYFICF